MVPGLDLGLSADTTACLYGVLIGAGIASLVWTFYVVRELDSHNTTLKAHLQTLAVLQAAVEVLEREGLDDEFREAVPPKLAEHRERLREVDEERGRVTKFIMRLTGKNP